MHAPSLPLARRLLDLLILALGTGWSLHAQSLSNPSFEADTFTTFPGYASGNGGSITGWTLSSPGSAGLNSAGNSPFADNGLIPDGKNVAFIQSSAGTVGLLSTTITGLTPGVVYEVSFRANSRASTAAPSPAWSLNGGDWTPFTASPPVGAGKPYDTVIGSFRATATTASLALANQTVADSALLVDDFRIVARQAPGSGWTVSRWANDASSGWAPAHTRWAYHFASTPLANVNGVVCIGLAGPNPTVPGRLSITGVDHVYGSHQNSLTAQGGLGSAVVARDFIYGGSPATITVEGLAPGQGYRISLLGVGFDLAPRRQTFLCGADSVEVDESAVFGVGNGLRVEYSFTATGTSQTITITPHDAATFHLYGLALLTTSTLEVNGPALLTHECHTPYTDPGAISGPLAIAAGLVHSLALRSDGTVAAWGINTYGQAAVPASLGDVVAVAAGYLHSLALRNDGTVLAWGANGSHQTDVPAGLNHVVAIASGGYHGLAVRSEGTVASWGDNGYGQSAVPAGLSNVVAVAAGGVHSLALRSEGTVAAWGNNTYGQAAVPAGLTDVVAVAAGYLHNLALRSDGTVVAWGENTYGQSAVPAGLTNVVAIAAGYFHSLALRSDGTVAAWGDNSNGQTAVPAGLTGVVAISGGRQHSLGLRSDGTVAAWGVNDDPTTVFPNGLYRQATITGSVNADSPGTYALTYTVTNLLGGSSANRTVQVQDTRPPLLTLTGPDTVILTTHAYTEAGATAQDDCAGSLPVTIRNTVNPDYPGIYTNTYSATDNYGHTATTNRVVYVPLPPTAPIIPGDLNGDGRVDVSEFAAVYAQYAGHSPFLSMTNVAGLGDTNVTFALPGVPVGSFSVEVSTDLLTWKLLGPAVPRYLFTDTNAVTAPLRYYRLRYP